MLQREDDLLNELKEATRVLRNEAACVVQKHFRGFLLRKALKEELEGTVLRWPDAPPGKVHEAELSLLDRPQKGKRLTMHFCSLRKSYVCSLPFVSGRLRLRFFVDGRPYIPQSAETAGTTERVLLLPASPLRYRVAPRYPWKAAKQQRQQAQQQGRQHNEHQQQQRLQPQQAEGSPEVWAKQKGVAPPFGPRRMLGGGPLAAAELAKPCDASEHLLAKPSCSTEDESQSSSSYDPCSWSCSSNSSITRTRSCNVSNSSNSSSSEETELSPLQNGPSWASGLRLSLGGRRRRHLERKWMKDALQQQQEKEPQQSPIQQQLSRNQQLQQLQELQQLQGTPSAELTGHKTLSTCDSEDRGSPLSARALLSVAERAVAPAVKTQQNEALVAHCPCLSVLPSRWALCRATDTSLETLVDSEVSPKHICQPPSHRREGGAGAAAGAGGSNSETPDSSRREGEHGDALCAGEEEYPWTSWPWEYSKGARSAVGPPQQSGPLKGVRPFLDPGPLWRFSHQRDSSAYACNGSNSSSSSSAGVQAPHLAMQGAYYRQFRKCREALMESTDLTGALLWARKRSHSHWELRRAFSTRHLLVRFTRSLSLQW